MVPGSLTLTGLPIAIVRSIVERDPQRAMRALSAAAAMAQAANVLGDFDFDVPRHHSNPRQFARVHGRRSASLRSRSNRRKHKR